MFKNVTVKEQNKIAKSINCEVVQKIKYLGIYMTNKNIGLYQNNYVKLWKKMKEDLAKWNLLKLFLLGRIAVIKMNILPRLLYLLQTLPIIKDKRIFKIWHKEISKFVWEGGGGLENLGSNLKSYVMPKERGGLKLPHFETYHKAICLSWIREWMILQKPKMLALAGTHIYFMRNQK